MMKRYSVAVVLAVLLALTPAVGAWGLSSFVSPCSWLGRLFGLCLVYPSSTSDIQSGGQGLP